MKMAVWMDPLHAIYPKKDSSIAMIQRAQELGIECYYFTIADLFCQNGEGFAQVYDINLLDLTAKRWYESNPQGIKPLNYFDIILIRKDPPVDMAYLYALNILELAEKAGVLVANKPQSLRDVNEKMFTLHFPHCIPDTLVTSNIEQLKTFWAQHREVIFKPLNGMGGHNIFHVSEDGRNLSVILHALTAHQTQIIMAQRFIPEIYTVGDKRIILIDGKPISHALARFPAPGESRGNLAAGGFGKVVPLSEHDEEICQQIGPILRERGLLFVGIDVIGKYLTEINVTSPTCIREITDEVKIDITGHYLDILKDKMKMH